MDGFDLSTFDDSVPREIVALGITYPDGYIEEKHSHRRAQLLYGTSGVLMLTTQRGAWMMPPHRGMWIPPGTEHEVKMLGSVAMRSIYIEPAASKAPFDHCQVVSISGLMKELLMEAATLPRHYDKSGRDGAVMDLILHELRRLSPVPLTLPLPGDAKLSSLCRDFLLHPNSQETVDDWVEQAAMSRRTFTRRFKSQTGLSFVAWRQQACLMSALPRLAQGEAITTVAFDLGYENPASFTAMFVRLLGIAPREYLRSGIATPAQPVVEDK
ncbi:AraC family transcriptional regulator [Agrobacterium pusense]|uniref:AraC family transcriptional regulator n=1 Tax=Agrobacterium pusense TaxID=648995 RepID=UPI00289A51A7|nr:helix-turn-helix transcriptional regulator [Agrobacterium pusense]